MEIAEHCGSDQRARLVALGGCFQICKSMGNREANKSATKGIHLGYKYRCYRFLLDYFLVLGLYFMFICPF